VNHGTSQWTLGEWQEVEGEILRQKGRKFTNVKNLSYYKETKQNYNI